jgi:hypothetical protein
VDEPPKSDETVYTSRQRAVYLAPLCTACSTGLIPQWIDAAKAAGPNRMFRLAYTFCGNGCEDR